jgi:hypothetical protein
VTQLLLGFDANGKMYILISTEQNCKHPDKKFTADFSEDAPPGRTKDDLSSDRSNWKASLEDFSGSYNVCSPS